MLFRSGIPFRGGPYTMGGPQDDVHERISELVPRLMTAPALRSPHELVFLHRGLGGVYSILKQLKPTADWGGIFEDVAGRCMAERDRAHGVAR